jgi:hypothetical protein
MYPILFGRLRKSFRSWRAKPRLGRRPGRARLQLEPLEDRLVPDGSATLMVTLNAPSTARPDAAILRGIGDMNADGACLVPLIVPLVRTKNPDREAALLVLRKLGPAGRAAAPALLQMLSDEDPFTAATAAAVLKAMNVSPNNLN